MSIKTGENLSTSGVARTNNVSLETTQKYGTILLFSNLGAITTYQMVSNYNQK